MLSWVGQVPSVNPRWAQSNKKKGLETCCDILSVIDGRRRAAAVESKGALPNESRHALNDSHGDFVLPFYDADATGEAKDLHGDMGWAAFLSNLFKGHHRQLVGQVIIAIGVVEYAQLGKQKRRANFLPWIRDSVTTAALRGYITGGIRYCILKKRIVSISNHLGTGGDSELS